MEFGGGAEPVSGQARSASSLGGVLGDVVRDRRAGESISGARADDPDVGLRIEPDQEGTAGVANVGGDRGSGGSRGDGVGEDVSGPAGGGGM